jgi:hypothetical protein
MGIRFNCPYCQKKLNVKSFLAGKRGICPYCDRGLDIPLEGEAGNGKAQHLSESVEVRTIETDSAQAAQLAAEAFAQPFSSTASTLPAPATPGSAPPGNAIPGNAAPTDKFDAGAADAQPTPPSKPQQAPQPDPIDENPEAVWYVRPPSGGQFGPAKGDVMRTWLAEGRVSPDALVWREGWADWKEAEPVFPSLAKRSTPPPPPASAAAPSPPAATSPASAKPTPRPVAATPVAAAKPVAVASPAPRTVTADSYATGAVLQPSIGVTSPAKPLVRRRSPVPALIAVAALVLISLALLIGLILVLTGTINLTG